MLYLHLTMCEINKFCRETQIFFISFGNLGSTDKHKFRCVHLNQQFLTYVSHPTGWECYDHSLASWDSGQVSLCLWVWGGHLWKKGQGTVRDPHVLWLWENSFCMKCRVLYLDSKPVLLNLWVMTPLCQRTLLQGLPKTIFHVRYLHYYS